jgi:DNA polymerase-1
MKKLLLIDGNSMLFRAYYATLYGRRMSTSQGIPTNAVFGFITMLNKAIETTSPDAILVAWDAGKPTFRHKQFQDYKGTRKPLDDELIVQMPIVREFLDSAGIFRYEQEGYEADDIIGSTAASASNDMEVTILTSDKDMLQLISDSTKVLLMKKGLSEMDVMNEAALKEKYGLSPKQIIDLKGLMGDASDNIPGVKGVGEKTALKLLDSYQSVEGVYEHIDEVKGKLKEKLEAGKESALMSKELATIFTQMDLPFDLTDLNFDQPKEDVNDFYRRYEMKSLLSVQSHAAKKQQASWPIETVSDFSFEPEKEVLIMPVATIAPFMDQKMYGLLIGHDEKVTYISKEDAQKSNAFKESLAQAKNLLAWDGKQLMHVLDLNELPVAKIKEDLHLAAFLLYSQATSEDALVEALELTVPFSYKDLTKKSLGGDSEERVSAYCFALIPQLMQKKQSILDQVKEQEMSYLYEEVEKPLSSILFEMEKEGVRVDENKLEELKTEFSARMQKEQEAIYSYASAPFNIDSPKQLGNVLFDELQLSSGKKRSTAVDVLEKLQGSHPIIDHILEYRKYSKLLSTYIDGLKKHLHNGRIYTTFNQTMTQTGRLSSSDPNLQNISVKSEEGKKVREVFVPDEGCLMIASDYSQVELRVLAHMANEQIMIDTFKHDGDIHTKTACEIFGVSPDQVDDSMRRVAKTVNFGIIYGQTDFGLSQELHISRAEARNFMQTYFASYPNIHRYMDEAVEFCEEHGYAITMLKRRRPIPEIKDRNYMTREFGKRAAMNAPIQGSAADLIKIAMIKVDQAIKEKGLKSKMLLQIHDELIFDVPKEEEEIMMELVAKTMDEAMQLNVPLKSSVHAGNNWAEAK